MWCRVVIHLCDTDPWWSISTLLRCWDGNIRIDHLYFHQLDILFDIYHWLLVDIDTDRTIIFLLVFHQTASLSPRYVWFILDKATRLSFFEQRHPFRNLSILFLLNCTLFLGPPLIPHQACCLGIWADRFFAAKDMCAPGSFPIVSIRCRWVRNLLWVKF